MDMRDIFRGFFGFGPRPRGDNPPLPDDSRTREQDHGISERDDWSGIGRDPSFDTPGRPGMVFGDMLNQVEDMFRDMERSMQEMDSFFQDFSSGGIPFGFGTFDSIRPEDFGYNQIEGSANLPSLPPPTEDKKKEQNVRDFVLKEPDSRKVPEIDSSQKKDEDLDSLLGKSMLPLDKIPKAPEERNEIVPRGDDRLSENRPRWFGGSSFERVYSTHSFKNGKWEGKTIRENEAGKEITTYTKNDRGETSCYMKMFRTNHAFSSKAIRHSENSYYEEKDKPKRGILLLGCRYDVILRVAMENNYKMVGEGDTFYLIWSDAPVPLDKIHEMRRNQTLAGSSSPPIQKMNHFPGMYEICRKDRLGRNLNKMKRSFPSHYNFFPPTWDLPTEMSDLLEYDRRHKNACYIIKPDSGCQGKGIFLVKNLKLLCPFAKCVAQYYVPQPFLIDGLKFDQRIYVLITCADPLRIYIYNEGIARFATVKYQIPSEKNLDVTYMHLTNYSLNKFSDSFDLDSQDGTKRPLSEIYRWMADHGYDIHKLKKDIDEIIVKTVICVAPALRHSYRATFPKRDKGCYCFELLGFDILIDRHLRPMLIEVNHSPSFNLDTPVDTKVKFDLMRDLFSILYISEDAPGELWKKDPLKYNIHRRPGTPHSGSISDALKDQFAYEETHQNNFRLIFCEENPGKFSLFMDKEYFLLDSEDDQYLKKRLEPSMRHEFDTTPRKQHRTAIRETPAGEIYVETRQEPNSLMNPKECFKFRIEATKQDQVMKSNKALKTDKKKSLFDKDLSVLTGRINKLMDPVEPIATVTSKLLPDTTGNLLNLSPSQRVQAAIDQLRKKNVEKFKTITQHSNSILKHYTEAAAILDDQLLFSHVPSNESASRRNKLTEAEKAARSNSEQLKKQGSESILNLDVSKLPSVFQHAVHATQLQLETVKSNMEQQETVRNGSNTNNNNNNSANNLSFDPEPKDRAEERRRIKSLASRKRAIGILGIGETARKVVEMVAAVVPSQRLSVPSASAGTS